MKQKTISPVDYLWLALFAFAGFGLEILLSMIEPGWGDSVHQLVTTALWVTMAVILYFLAKKRYHFDLFAVGHKPSPAQFTSAVVLTGIGIATVTLAWSGFKPSIELQNLGTTGFIVQYIYYLAECLLILLSIVFAQKFMDEIIGNSSQIPWGGLFLALTWGSVHFLTQDIMTGLTAMLWALIYGGIYNFCGKKTAYAFPLILIVFLL